MLTRLGRSYLRRALTGERDIALERRELSLEGHFEGLEELGIYLHVPFCERICPYCPYNKEIYRPDVAPRYTKAVKTEIDLYAELIGDSPVTSFYIGGGTPTTMLHSGLSEVLDHIHRRFDVRCEIHLESHPNHLTPPNLDTISSMGIDHLSIGVESLQDRHLELLKRPYSAEGVKAAVGRAVARGFKCVNTDLMFAFPGQTYEEVEEAGRALVEMEVDQVAAYPLFLFPYTPMGREAKDGKQQEASVFKRRKMFRILEGVFRSAGFERTSVWAFTRKGVPKYCSVTVPLYVGLGASGSTYLKDVFYLNTFHVAEYIRSLEQRKLPIALSLQLSEKMQMAGWLYWRIYETRFSKEDFKTRFRKEFDTVYGRYVKFSARLGFLSDDGKGVVLSDRGAFWLHALEDLFSINYVGRLWGDLKRDPWPQRIAL
jgi:oxygen-independent coproporphyrinogen-3 oxidase